jgi:putative oligomerization/nucleic acid binding protein/PH (Pleckstrin Homology) domain-containing protein
MTTAGGQAQGADESPRVQAALAQLQGLLVPGETLQTYAVQSRVFALTRRRVIVGATSGRLIALFRGLIAGFKVVDLRWQDLKDVRLDVGIFGADLTISILDQSDLATGESAAGMLLLHGLRKEQAQAVYRVCQAQEQAWREKRRVRDLEELRAKSGGLQFGGGVGAPAAGETDPVERLKAAKEMLANGLITDAEYEAIKAKVVSGL